MDAQPEPASLASPLEGVRPLGKPWLAIDLALPLLGSIALIVAWWLIPQELEASDPSAYSKRAFAIASDFDFGKGHIFDTRLGLVVPMAMIYRIFGVSIGTTNLWPLLCVVGLVWLVWYALENAWSRFVGVSLTLTSAPLFATTLEARPNGVTAAFVAVSLGILTRRHRLREPLLPCLAIVAGVALVVAAATKLTAYWALSAWAVALWTDARASESPATSRRFWRLAVGAGLLAALAYVAFSAIVWDDAFRVFSASEAHEHPWAIHSKKALVERLTGKPAAFFVRVVGWPTLLLTAIGLLRSTPTLLPWRAYLVAGVVLFWFGPTTLHEYSPLPLDPRMVVPLLPAFFVVAGSVFERELPRIRRVPTRPLVALLFVGFASWDLPTDLARYRRTATPEAVATKRLQKRLRKRPNARHLLVCADTRSCIYLAFYFGYRYPDNLVAVPFEKLDRSHLSADHHYVYAHTRRGAFLRRAYKKADFTKKLLALRGNSLLEEPPVYLREVDGAELARALEKRRLAPPARRSR